MNHNITPTIYPRNSLKPPRMEFRQLALYLVSALSMLVGIAILLVSGGANAADASKFDVSNIISDGVFYNASSMSANEIQGFLNAKVPTCDTNHGSYTGASGVTYNPPWTCLKDYSTTTRQIEPDGYCSGYTAGTQTAAQIIYGVAKSCGINPQVLLVILQKEQSLVTDTWPGPWQYRSATGLGCGDNSACESRYYGLFNQLYGTARQFKLYQANPSGYNYISGRNNTLYYNPGPCKTWGSDGGCSEWYGQYKTKRDIEYCGSAQVYIQNQATAALYNYTPYAPNQASLNAGYGTGNGCSSYGNRNFWLYFTDWFGSTYTPAYSAKPTYQSAHVTVFPGDSVRMTARYQNTGNVAWYDDFTAWNAGKPVVKLGTDGPLNRSSAFGGSWRWGSTRASDVFSAVYEADGVTLAANQHVVLPGQIGEFSFTLTIPRAIAAGNYQEAFRPIVEGGSAMPGNGVWWIVSVQKPTYTAQPAGQSYYPRLIQGDSAPAYFKYQNTGNVAWYDDFTAWNAGKPVVKLGTDGPLNRSSAFGGSWRWGSTRASDVFSAVYEADGVTLAANQHVVLPGQIGEFSFTFKSTSRTAPGFYHEGFRPIVEGVGEMNATGTWLGVTVVAANYSAAPVAQSYYPTIKQGQSAPAYFSFKNTGNVAWYDDFTAWNAGQMPVKLGTNNPLNRSSVFGSSWRWGPTRASDVFAAVYEADGVTLTSNQHVVMPGQIGRFDFTFTVPATLAPGYYPEAFLPIVEGYTVMNVSGGPWLGVTVIR